ncbi:hypothetical protein [Candidatus Accumulibacter phosphatis]|uniref:hypothetical protein n=1 Tax=Candidatus Accumulibacter phosphatis TaxID=327160 RepID=UPI0020C089DD|nr:hypothetical protein [Candidatus Accumulibacter phosphatis]
MASAQAIESTCFREAAHFDGELDGLAAAADLRVGRRAGNGDDLQVEVWREATVQAQLRLAAGLALGERAVVEEGQEHRLLDLVGEGSGQEQP